MDIRKRDIKEGNLEHTSTQILLQCAERYFGNLGVIQKKDATGGHTQHTMTCKCIVDIDNILNRENATGPLSAQ